MPSIHFDPPFIAHRGANNVAPENTISAFKQAFAEGAKWVEFDVMLTACGEAVVFHDDTLERTTNGSGLVIDHTYAELVQLDAGSWFSPAFKGERIPLFRDVLTLLKSLPLCANIEIKPYPGTENQTVEKVLSDFRAVWPEASPLFSSFSMPALQHLRLLAPDVNIGVLIHEWFSGWQEYCVTLNCASVNLNHEIITPEYIQQIHALGVPILAYTVNSKALAKHLMQMGVDAFFTDDFPRLNATR